MILCAKHINNQHFAYVCRGSEICHDVFVEDMSLFRYKRVPRQDSINGAWFEHFDVAHWGVSAAPQE